MIKIIENNGIVLLYLAVLSILIYTIYLVFYNWYIEKRLNKKIKKLRLFEPIKWIHFASIPLTILYLISQTVMMVYTTESNKDALNLLKSYRSEERREGKECRCRRPIEHNRKYECSPR